jgi:hypothetical protein
MRKFVLAALTLIFSLGLTIAAQVTFVSFDAEKKELKVKDGDEEKTYKITDKTTYKTGDKETPAEKGVARLGKLKDKAKLEVTVEKDTITEIKFAAPKAKSDK